MGRIANKYVCSLQAFGALRTNVRRSHPFHDDPLISPEGMANQPLSYDVCGFVSAAEVGRVILAYFMIVKTPQGFQPSSSLILQHFVPQPCTYFPKSFNSRSRSSSACNAKHKWMLNPHQWPLISWPVALL